MANQRLLALACLAALGAALALAGEPAATPAASPAAGGWSAALEQALGLEGEAQAALRAWAADKPEAPPGRAVWDFLAARLDSRGQTLLAALAAGEGPLALAFPAGRPLVVEPDAPGFGVLAVGQRAVLPLAGNPTTGYSWSARAEGAALRAVGEPLYLATAPAGGRPLLGGGGSFFAVFAGAAVGEGRALAEYRRPWEKGQAPARSVAAEFLVREPPVAGAPRFLPAAPGLFARLATDRDEYRVGESPQVAVEFLNRGAEAIRLYHGLRDDVGRCFAVVFDPALTEQPLARTRVFRAPEPADYLELAPGQAALLEVLSPEGAVRDQPALSLFAAPGPCEIRLAYRLPENVAPDAQALAGCLRPEFSLSHRVLVLPGEAGENPPASAAPSASATPAAATGSTEEPRPLGEER